MEDNYYTSADNQKLYNLAPLIGGKNLLEEIDISCTMQIHCNAPKKSSYANAVLVS